MTNGPHAAELVEPLTAWATSTVPGAAAVTAVAPMPGNAGLSFGFDVLDSVGDRLAALVVRLAPPGVRRQGNTDVLRQVPLLDALGTSGIPIAELVWSNPPGDEEIFGTDAIIQRRLDAKPLHMIDEEASVPVGWAGTEPFLRRAVEVLADIHRVPWSELLPGWDEPRTIVDDLGFWLRLVERSPEARWAEAGEKLLTALVTRDPGAHRIGLCHGDYQTNNLLFEADGTLAAVVDWEITAIGPTGLDLGWLAMMTDPTCWHDSHRRRMRVVVEPAELREWYEIAAGVSVDNFTWYRCYAVFKFACIVAFNVHLHRSGRRVDDAYEEMAPSVDTLFAKGMELSARLTEKSSVDAE